MILQFPFNNQASNSNDSSLSIHNANDEVLLVTLRHPVVTFQPSLLRDVSNLSEDTKNIQESLLVIGTLKRTNRVTLRELSSGRKKSFGE